MTRTAFAVWENRIAPVFDVAGSVCLVDSDKTGIVGREVHSLPGGSLQARAGFLAEQGVNSLVCGAVSRALQWMMVSRGISVVPFISGELDEIVSAWFSGEFKADVFRMPGCGGYRRGRKGHENGMNPRRGRGGIQGPPLPWPYGSCACPECGHREPRVQGVPCALRQCRECGCTLIRKQERRT